MLTNFQSQKSFSSIVERLAAWGLETDDVSFVRRDMTALLFKYMKQGDAVVEYEAWLSVLFVHAKNHLGFLINKHII